ncbi:MAG: L-2-amino-thiazoline-4-carboxylic acid hydrolase [Anaerolineae bacterium]|nr:L-2-amino-thiazoline-4-carboxylic acid hydrolase [Anaerolineae bacterium]
MSNTILTQLPSDTLNDIGVLKRREIEARVIGPIIEAMCREFDRDRVLAVLRDTIIKLAQTQGAALAGQMGGNSTHHFAKSMANWTKDNALEIEVLTQTDQRFEFNVTRCRYAEMYRALGLAELGATLSCNRDGALIEGFNPDIKLERAQTIMQGAPCCTFRYARAETEN